MVGFAESGGVDQEGALSPAPPRDRPHGSETAEMPLTPPPSPPPHPPAAEPTARARMGDLSDTRPSLLVQLRALSARSPARAGAEGAGADRAWHRFFEMYSPPVYRVAQRRGLSAPDAEDVVQQVMLAVIGHIGDFEYEATRGRFRHWVLRIAERKIADALRKRLTLEGKTTRPMAEHAEFAAREDHEREWSEQWRLQDLLYCLDEVAAEISPKRMEAFRMYVLQGVPAEETARAAGMTVGHVYVTRSQVLKLIRAKLERLARWRDEDIRHFPDEAPQDEGSA